MIKAGRLRWLDRFLEYWSRLAIRWLDSVEDDLKTMGVRNWRRKSQNRGKRRTFVVKEVKVHHGF
jgi:hypothetical protein